MIVIELELDNPYDLTDDEIEEDIRMSEDQIGWNYDYKIKTVKIIKN